MDVWTRRTFATAAESIKSQRKRQRSVLCHWNPNGILIIVSVSLKWCEVNPSNALWISWDQFRVQLSNNSVWSRVLVASRFVVWGFFFKSHTHTYMLQFQLSNSCENYTDVWSPSVRPDFTLVSLCTRERFSGVAEQRPVAGTRPRGRSGLLARS